MDSALARAASLLAPPYAALGAAPAPLRAAGVSQSGEEREAGWPLGPLEPALGPG